MSKIYRLLFGIVFLLGIGQAPLFGQNNKIDSLENIITSSGNPTDKVKAYRKLAKYYYKSAPAKSLYYLEKAEKTCIDHNLDSLYSYVLSNISQLYRHTDREKTKVYLFKALEYANKSDNIFYSAKIYNNIGNLYHRENIVDSAEYYLNKSLKIKKMLSDKYPDNQNYMHSYLISLMNMGTMYMQRKNEYKKSIKLYYDALEQAKKMQDSSVMCSVLLNIGVIYYYNKNYDNALVEFNQAIVIARKLNKTNSLAAALTNLGAISKEEMKWKEADSLFTAALLIRLEIGPKSSIAGLYENLGLVSVEINEYKKALDYYNKSLEIKLVNKVSYEMAAIYANMGNLYFLMKNYSMAEKYLLFALDNATLAKDLEKLLEINTSLSRLYEVKGQYSKSLDYYKEYKAIDDSIHSLKSAQTISLYREKFEGAEKDKQIAEFENQQKLNALIHEKQKLNNRLLMIGILAIVLISIFILLLLNNRRKTEKELFKKNTELSQQKMLELVKEQEMNSVNSFISGQERERSRIASDLHDRLGSLLSTVKLHFSSIEPFLEKDQELAENFSYVISLLDQSVAEVRSVSHNLAKEILTEFGVVGAIENLMEAINSAGNLKLIFINTGFEHRLSYEKEIEIYRIIQELVTNAIKHADASELVIQFVVDADILTITIEDDGVGFDAAKVKSNGMGLNNIFERTAKINGKYALDTSPGNGATFIFEIPIGKTS